MQKKNQNKILGVLEEGIRKEGRGVVNVSYETLTTKVEKCSNKGFYSVTARNRSEKF